MEDLKTILWRQAGASIEMMRNAISACPDELWTGPDKFWYVAYHTLFYLDYYSSQIPEDFSPPEPFDFSEFDPDGAFPPRVYTKQELLDYVDYAKQKCREYVEKSDAEKRFVNGYRDLSQPEMVIYNLRHVQHHAAQLNMLLRQHGLEPPRWVSGASV